MPLLKQACCCCCDLSTGLIIISILSLLSSGFNIYTTLGLEGLIKTSITLQVFGIFATSCSFVPSMKNNQEHAKAKRNCVIPFIVWCISALIFNGVLMLYVHVVLNGASLTVMQIGVCINIVFLLWGFLVSLSYYQMLKGNNVESNYVTMPDEMTNELLPPAYDTGCVI